MLVTQETFFRPLEQKRIPSTIAADVYNRTRRLLFRAQHGCVFVPIRTMQYLAIIDEEEIIFIDSISGYLQHQGKGGRMVEIAWQHFRPQDRTSLLDPISCEIVYYWPGAETTMKRLIREFHDALMYLERCATPIMAISTHVIDLSSSHRA
jgi:hypothetical protein